VERTKDMIEQLEDVNKPMRGMIKEFRQMEQILEKWEIRESRE
jgi:hypothetical protein